MFGSFKPAGQTSTFGAFGQQQQQPQQQTSLFGQPAQTTTFGQPQQQTSGLFGSTSTPSFGAANTSFGTPFGKPATSTAFGAPAPATPFGQSATPAFGAPSSTPSFTFGANNNATNTFGANQQQTTSFGGGIFGAANNQGKDEFPPDSLAGHPIPTNGSSVPFQPQQKRDLPLRKLLNSQTEAPYDANLDNMHTCQHIGFQKEYWNISPEELRWQDYQQNRKTPQPGAGAATSASGAFTFGQQPQQQQTGGLFGTTSTATPFGQTSAPAFGQNTGTTGGLFGKPATSTFGTTPAPTFGAQPATSSPFSFGTTPTPAPAFGQTNTSPFGTQASQPAATGGLFGQATPSSGLFGNSGASSAPTSSFTFGQNNQTNNAPKPFSFGTSSGGGGLFGQTSAPASGFGSTTTTAPQPTSGFSFGANNTQPQTTFGQPQPAQTNTFGSPGGLFGGASESAAPSVMRMTRLLDSNTAANKPLFGTPSATPGFGTPTSSPFSFGTPKTSAPATGGLFNFGTPQTQTPAPVTQPFSFGNPTGGGLFGSQQNTNTGQTGGLFGMQSQNTAAPPPTNDANPYGSNPLFNAPPGTPAKAPFYTPSEPQAKIKPALNTLPVRTTPKPMGKITRLRFAPSSNAATPNFNRMSNSPSSLLLNNGRNSPTLTMGLGDAVLSPNAFVTKQNVKRLDLTHRASTPDLRDRSGSLDPNRSGSVARPPKVQWNPELEMATPKRAATPSSAPAKTTPSLLGREASRSPTSTLVSTGEASEYICKPSLEELERYGAEELAHVEGFTVERPGAGKIEFVQPVDLTTVPSLRSIPGEIIRLQPRELQVYADTEVPEPGTGLNVPCIVTLENAWPKDKSTGRPQKTTEPAKLEKAIHTLKKRTARMGATFIDFDTETGVWTFSVKSF